MTTAAKPAPVYATRAAGDGCLVLRDGEVLKTPAGRDVLLPAAGAAAAVAAECSAQGDRLDLRAMPMTQFALTSIDITALQRDNVIDGIMRYGDSELVCHRTAEPAGLATAQATAWDPYLDWATERFGARLTVTAGMAAQTQAPDSMAALRAAVGDYDEFILTALSEAVGMTGSLILGLAALQGFTTADAIVAAADAERLWQENKWGADPENVKRRAALLAELQNCVRWQSLVRASETGPK